MATKVIMPKAGMAMEDGVLVAWLKKVGDPVRSGEAIAEIETDKAVMDLEAEIDGVLLAIVRQVGERIPVTETIAWIGRADEQLPLNQTVGASHAQAAVAPISIQPEQALPATRSPDGKIAATPAARRLAAETGIELASIKTQSGAPLSASDVQSHIRKDATPLASRMAAASGIDLGSLSSETGQRARKSDVVSALADQGNAALMRQDRRILFTGIQKITGQRLSRSHAEIPSVTIFALANATELVEARERINASGATRVSLNDFIIRACAKALVANPRANAVVDGDGLILKGTINIGFAVATEAGLQVPTLHNADRLSLPEQALRTKDLADRARTRRLRPEELEDGTFTVSNIGMYGISSFTPIINQPQVGILGVGAIDERLALGPDRLPVVQKMLHLSFTFDHRAMDGAESSSFLIAVKTLVESPFLLIL